MAKMTDTCWMFWWLARPDLGRHEAFALPGTSCLTRREAIAAYGNYAWAKKRGGRVLKTKLTVEVPARSRGGKG